MQPPHRNAPGKVLWNAALLPACEWLCFPAYCCFLPIRPSDCGPLRGWRLHPLFVSVTRAKKRTAGGMARICFRLAVSRPDVVLGRADDHRMDAFPDWLDCVGRPDIHSGGILWTVGRRGLVAVAPYNGRLANYRAGRRMGRHGVAANARIADDALGAV